jgi:hypothetical protein
MDITWQIKSDIFRKIHLKVAAIPLALIKLQCAYCDEMDDNAYEIIMKYYKLEVFQEVYQKCKRISYSWLFHAKQYDRLDIIAYLSIIDKLYSCGPSYQSIAISIFLDSHNKFLVPEIVTDDIKKHKLLLFLGYRLDRLTVHSVFAQGNLADICMMLPYIPSRINYTTVCENVIQVMHYKLIGKIPLHLKALIKYKFDTVNICINSHLPYLEGVELDVN